MDDCGCDDADVFVARTKRMIVDVIACQPGERLTDILEKQASGTQVWRHKSSDHNQCISNVPDSSVKRVPGSKCCT